MTRREVDLPKGEVWRWRGEAPAKTNLLLRVLEREASGYHGIETLFQKLDLADEIEIRLRRGDDPEWDGEAGSELVLGGVPFRLMVEGRESKGLGDPRRNLVTRAVEAILDRVDLPGGLRIEVRVRKEIPHGAGLGGGSSDAATTLLGVNELLGTPLSSSEVRQIGISLGSDVPFFLQPGTLALGWGRGHRLMELPPLPARPVLVLVPDFRVPTPEAYAWLARARAESGDPLSDGVHYPLRAFEGWSQVRAVAENDFHRPVEAMHPAVRDYRRALDRAGAEIAILSGSGAAVVGVFSDMDSLERARGELAGGNGLRLLSTWTSGHPPEE